MAASAHEREVAEEIRNMSDIDLASFRKDHPNPASIYAILEDKEYEQRARLKQHKLDRKLIAEQVRWMKFSILAGVVSALAGVILGWYL